MSGLIVITGLDQLAPAERWSRLVNPLAAQFEESGLGELPDLAELRSEFRKKGGVNATEVAIRLVDFHYGHELVNRVMAAAGLEQREIIRPERWRPFHCDDYFASEYVRQGYWDELGQYWYLEPFDRIFENEERAFLVVGGAGVDGIQWGYRRGHLGFWAYPIDGDFVLLASTVDAFMHGWLAGEITL